MPPKPQTERSRRALEVLQRLQVLYPDARTELNYRDSFELLVATILSAQATDVSVNAATPSLFERYPNATSMAAATPSDLEPFIKSIGLYRNKAKHLVSTAQALVSRFHGEVPNDFNAIQTLPGVGRKTANVVLSNAFGRPGIAVDTHVGRLARRLGFSAHTDPDRVEHDLERVFPKDRWIFLHHALILHGRRVCTARAPQCDHCQLLLACPQIGLSADR